MNSITCVPSMRGTTNSGNVTPAASFAEHVAAFERGLLVKALEAAHWNQSEAARRLNLSRVTLIDKLKRHNIKKP